MTTPSPQQRFLLAISEEIKLAVLSAAKFLDHANRSKAKLQVEVKADNTLVMNLDIESQRIILNALPRTFPVVAEEDPASHALISDTESYFLVDPLDGTTSCKRFLGQQGGHVGYGPLVGFVFKGALAISAFYSVPHRQLFLAVADQGVTVTEFNEDWSELNIRPLRVSQCRDLKEAGMLFFISPLGEGALVELIRRENAVENIYRFGGFANDCARLAQGFEQVQLQFQVKPWDFSAALLAAEAGCEVFCDPLNRRIPLKSWRIEANNPLASIAPGGVDAFFRLVEKLKVGG